MLAPFEGRIFFELVARAARGSSLLSKGPSHLMLRSGGCSLALRARLFRRCNRARSGRRGAGGCDRLPRPSRFYAVMMDRERLRGHRGRGGAHPSAREDSACS
jgi:hypothetical protein